MSARLPHPGLDLDDTMTRLFTAVAAVRLAAFAALHSNGDDPLYRGLMSIADTLDTVAEEMNDRINATIHRVHEDGKSLDELDRLIRINAADGSS